MLTGMVDETVRKNELINIIVGLEYGVKVCIPVNVIKVVIFMTSY